MSAYHMVYLSVSNCSSTNVLQWYKFNIFCHIANKHKNIDVFRCFDGLNGPKMSVLTHWKGSVETGNGTNFVFVRVCGISL
jgi:hypothetical protein